jgi:hypothetical protein
MKTCGVELKGSEARLVILDGTKEQFNHKVTKVCKIDLADDESTIEVRAFRDVIFAFFRENCLESIAIKKRSKRGEYAGGAVSFKIESIIQLYEGCPVSLLSAVKIAAVLKNSPAQIPTALYVYQHEAFRTSYAALP